MFRKGTVNELTGDRTGVSERLKTNVFGDGDVWTYVIAGLTATFGILSGYALYVLWWEQEEKGESGWIFALAFAAAAVMSFAFEVLRSAIEGNKFPWSRFRVISTLVMLAAFELFIIAAHGAVEMYRDLAKIAGFIFGAQFADTVGPGWNLVALGGLWIVVALTITLKLRKFIVGWPYPNSTAQPQGSLRKYLAEAQPDLRRGTLAGLSAGVFWGILSAVSYVFLFRALGLAQWIHSNPAAWSQSFEGYPTFHLPRFALMILYGPAIVSGICAEHFGAWGLFIGVAVISLIAYAVTPEGSRGLAALWPPLTMLFLLGLPILADQGARRDLCSLALLVVVIWGVPATLLGAVAPLLRQPAHNPPVWGLVAAAAACVLMAVTMTELWATSANSATRDDNLPLLLMVCASALLFLLAFYLFRGAWSEEFWVLMALSIGVIIFGTTTLVNKVSLYAMQKSAHYLIALPLGPVPPEDPMDKIFRNIGYRAVQPRSEGGILWLLPSGVKAGLLTCDTLRGWTPEQRNQFAVNLRQTAAGDNQAAVDDDTTRADYSTQLRKLDQQVRAAGGSSQGPPLPPAERNV